MVLRTLRGRKRAHNHLSSHRFSRRIVKLGSSSAVCVAAVLDGDDLYENAAVVDAIDDPELAAARRVPTLEPTTERLADAVGVLREWTPDELETCDSGRFG